MRSLHDVDAAIERLREVFPFRGYVGEDPAASIRNIASVLTPHLPKGARILDFGSGPMDKTGALQFLGYRCSAVDDLSDFWHLQGRNRERIIEFAARTGIDFHFDVSELDPEPETFDAVTLCDVLEHIHDSPRPLLENLLLRLKPNGYVFILVPHAANIRKRIALLQGKTNLSDYRVYYWSDVFRGHVREYVKDDLRQLADFLALDIIELKTCHNMLTKVPGLLRPLYKAITALFPGWRDTLILLARKPADWRLPPSISKAEYQRLAGNSYVEKALEPALYL